MKIHIKFLSMFLIMCGIVALNSCNQGTGGHGNPDPIQNPDTPSNLAVSNITHDSATLSWQHADADSHEVVVGDAAAVTVTSLSYEVSGLTPETAYTWKVRSSKNNIWSQWAEGDEFTTGIFDPLAYDTTLNNEWTWNGQRGDLTYSDINIVGGPGLWVDDTYFWFGNSPDRTTEGIRFWLPTEKIATELPLVEGTSSDYWMLDVSVGDELYYGLERNLNDIAQGHLIVTREPTNSEGTTYVTFDLAVEWTDGTILKANWNGESVDTDFVP